MDGNKLTWVEEITATSAANFNRLEALVQDAVQDSKQMGLISARPAASPANKNWIWTDSASGRASYSDGTQWIELSPTGAFAPVDYLVNSNTSIAAPPQSITTYLGTVVGQAQLGGGSFSGRLLLIGQTDTTQNGLYDFDYNSFNGARSLTRCTDANRSEHFRRGMTVQVMKGGAIGAMYAYNGTTAPIIGTSPLTFVGATEAWHVIGNSGEPAFQNGWTNFSAGFQVARFCRKADSWVEIEGFVKSGAASSTIFTLPVGYRPTGNLRFPQSAGSAYGQIDVRPDGTVGHLVGSTGDFSINCHFKAEQ